MLRSGQSYIDVHTVNFPTSLRGQVQNSFNGFQCGSDRPEALNPLVAPGNGVREKDFINFCARLCCCPSAGVACSPNGRHGQAAVLGRPTG